MVMEKKKSEHKLSKVEVASTAKGGTISTFKKWLFENYELKVNMLDANDIYIVGTKDNPIEYEYDITESDIYLHALEDGLSISRSIINNIIQSPNQCVHYNPIKEYFDNLKGKYKGVSQIDYIINSLHMSASADKEKNGYIIKKWLVAMAACVYGKRPNDVALGIISDRAGIGKTTFFDEIVPVDLRKYTMTLVKSNNNHIQSGLFSNKLLINMDELAAITPGTENEFKMLVSAEKVITNIAGTQRSKLTDRLASVCFTSNKTHEMGGFIRTNDPGLLRRLAVIEVDSIDDYREKLDRDMLWAEVITLLEGGYDYTWNQEDYQYLHNSNLKYIVATNAMKLIRMYYEVPMKNDKIRYMSSLDVLLEMKRDRKIPSSMTGVDEISIGKALSQAGFKRCIKRIKDIGPRYVYEMKAINGQA